MRRPHQNTQHFGRFIDQKSCLSKWKGAFVQECFIRFPTWRFTIFAFFLFDLGWNISEPGRASNWQRSSGFGWQFGWKYARICFSTTPKSANTSLYPGKRWEDYVLAQNAGALWNTFCIGKGPHWLVPTSMFNSRMREKLARKCFIGF